MNPKFVIQQSETLPVELTGTHDSYLYLISKLASQWGFWFRRGAWVFMHLWLYVVVGWDHWGGDKSSVWIFIVLALGVLALSFYFYFYFFYFLFLCFVWVIFLTSLLFWILKRKKCWSWKLCSPFVFVHTILDYIYILFFFLSFSTFYEQLNSVALCVKLWKIDIWSCEELHLNVDYFVGVYFLSSS